VNLDITKGIQQSWGWIGIEPAKVVDENDFGNLIIEDTSRKYWRLCPEDLYCTIIAQDRRALDELLVDQEFLEDWHMSRLLEEAKDSLGLLSDGYKYCLAIPGPLGGAYAISNMKIVPLIELIAFSGDLAERIKDLPDGARVKLEVI